MKTIIKTIVVVLPLIAVALFSWQCSYETTLNPVNSQNPTITDNNPNDAYVFSIREHVLVVPGGGGESYEEDRPLASFTSFQYTPLYFMMMKLSLRRLKELRVEILSRHYTFM